MQNPKSKTFLIFLAVFLSLACIWDKDTIEMEKQRFPNVLELISGNFLRHSPEFYRWRIADREKKIRQFPDSLSFYDDLAVAYEKTGNTQKAIEIMLVKEKRKPGLYETSANLGTFYIHNKELKKGLEFIEKAIEINPDAHFGREIYQKYVVEYILEKSAEGKFSLPLNKKLDIEMSREGEPNFHSFLRKQITSGKFGKKELTKAIKGIAGMMKFGNYDSTILLEVLGDLLLGNMYFVQDNAAQLACMAYLKASQKVGDSLTQKMYEQKAANCLLLYQDFDRYKNNSATFIDLKKALRKATELGELFYEEIRENEIHWIKQGKNPEDEFYKKYYRNNRKKEQEEMENFLKIEIKPIQNEQSDKPTDLEKLEKMRAEEYRVRNIYALGALALGLLIVLLALRYRKTR